jgi:hypothetical protein
MLRLCLCVALVALANDKAKQVQKLVIFARIKARLSQSSIKASWKQANHQVGKAMQARRLCRTRKQQGKASTKASNHCQNQSQS